MSNGFPGPGSSAVVRGLADALLARARNPSVELSQHSNATLGAAAAALAELQRLGAADGIGPRPAKAARAEHHADASDSTERELTAAMTQQLQRLLQHVASARIRGTPDAAIRPAADVSVGERELATLVSVLALLRGTVAPGPLTESVRDAAAAHVARDAGHDKVDKEAAGAWRAWVSCMAAVALPAAAHNQQQQQNTAQGRPEHAHAHSSVLSSIPRFETPAATPVLSTMTAAPAVHAPPPYHAQQSPQQQRAPPPAYAAPPIAANNAGALLPSAASDVRAAIAGLHSEGRTGVTPAAAMRMHRFHGVTGDAIHDYGGTDFAMAIFLHLAGMRGMHGSDAVSLVRAAVPAQTFERLRSMLTPDGFPPLTAWKTDLPRTVTAAGPAASFKSLHPDLPPSWDLGCRCVVSATLQLAGRHGYVAIVTDLQGRPTSVSNGVHPTPRDALQRLMASVPFDTLACDSKAFMFADSEFAGTHERLVCATQGDAAGLTADESQQATIMRRVLQPAHATAAWLQSFSVSHFGGTHSDGQLRFVRLLCWVRAATV